MKCDMSIINQETVTKNIQMFPFGGNKSLSRILWIQIHKERIPDHLADCCKHLSINWMAAGSKLLRYSHGIFLLPSNFKHTLKTSLGFCKTFWYTPLPFTSIIINILCSISNLIRMKLSY